jgi:hypothetical protein
MFPLAQASRIGSLLTLVTDDAAASKVACRWRSGSVVDDPDPIGSQHNVC